MCTSLSVFVCMELFFLSTLSSFLLVTLTIERLVQKGKLTKSSEVGSKAEIRQNRENGAISSGVVAMSYDYWCSAILSCFLWIEAKSGVTQKI